MAGTRCPDPERFAEAMRRCGVRDDRPVVVYDDVSGTSAARAWWLLRHHGHPDVRVLDGGWSWWLRVGGPVETGPVTPPYGDFDAASRGPAGGRRGRRGRRWPATGVLVDARAPERFRGEVEPVDPVAGHVPGAVNVPTARNLVAEGERAGRFRSAGGARGGVPPGARPGTEVGVYCGSGVTAAHDVLALELLGRAGRALRRVVERVGHRPLAPGRHRLTGRGWPTSARRG